MSTSLILPDHIYSREQLLRLDNELGRLEGELRNLNARTKSGLTSNSQSATVSPEFSEVAEQLINGQMNAASVSTARQNLAEQLQKYQVVHIVLSHQPPDVELEQLVHWFRKNITEQLFLEITLNPTIVGGIVIRAGSRVYDFSFERALHANLAVLDKAVGSV